MKLELRLLNGFLLLLPLLAWNLAFGLRLTLEAVYSDAHSPQWLLVAENISRFEVFALPLLLRWISRAPGVKPGWLLTLTYDRIIKPKKHYCA